MNKMNKNIYCQECGKYLEQLRLKTNPITWHGTPCWICTDCGSYYVFKSIFIRLSTLDKEKMEKLNLVLSKLDVKENEYLKTV